MSTLPERFMDKVRVDENGCWLWTGYILWNGYGRFALPRSDPRKTRIQYAHRYAYEVVRGPVTGELDHLCRVRRCVNPAHLEDVDHQTNTLRGMSPNVIVHRLGLCGPRCRLTPKRGISRLVKLTPHDVVEIRARRARGELQKSIAAAYGVDRTTVCNILTGKSWRHV
jgi:hypothetical protein